MAESLIVRMLLAFLKVWVGLMLCGVVMLPIVLYQASLPPRVGEHVKREDAPLSLPDSASDVCYFLPPVLGPSQAYEFSVPEADFKTWAKSRGVDVQPIGPTPVQIWRYLALIPHDQPSSPIDAPIGVVSVEEGLVYQWRFEDQSCEYVYDRRSGRAYFYSQSR